MATRRSRIKGIANIPQRRKVESKVNEDSNVFLKPEPKDKEVDSSGDAVESVSTTPSEDTSVNTGVQDDTSNSDSKIEPLPQPTTSALNTHNDLPRRRNTIKPLVNQKLFQRPKAKTDNLNQSNNNEDVKNATNTPTELEPVTNISNNNLPIQDLNQNQNELPNTHSTINTPNSHSQTEIIKSGSDTECTVAPLSPTKVINRSRIKAVPRLGHRRTSMTVHGSASESEDDSKRNYKRIRTESACSSISTTNESPMQTENVGSPQKSKEFSSIIQRKCKRTEQSRKMAEARRHFMHKFGNQIPDKQKLTMMDLIFYNPISNPMSQKPKKQLVEEVEDVEHEEVAPKEEVKQDVINNESDEENTIPAPQIKIGANGEIVIDEKSLVIENEETKRHREEIQKSKIVDGDFDTGYGIYKREKRSKDWSKEETLRFYKALNTLGTDFTLMVELFSGRSRRELKMKFKKEERVNRPLIDKALTQPVHFDITELRKEAEEQLLLEQERERQNLERRKSKSDIVPYIGRNKKTSKPLKNRKSKPPKEKSPDIYTTLERGISSICQSDSEDEDENENEGLQQTSEEVSDTTTKPTRSGRVPKPRKPYISQELPIVKKKKTKDSPEEEQENNLSNLSTLQPGSIMIVASQTPTGEPAFKVFMVTPTQNKIPITLTPDMLNNLTQVQNMGNCTNEAITLDNIQMAIPAPETITTTTTSTEVIGQEMWPPYEQSNISIPQDENIILPEDKNITLCSDGKYDVKLPECPSEEKILPD